MDARKRLIIIKGKDQTDSVASFQFHDGKCEVVYTSAPNKTYSFQSGNVEILPLQKKIDPAQVIVTANEQTIGGIDELLDFGGYYRIVRDGKKDLSFCRNEVQFQQNCLTDGKNQEAFQYFKETAAAISLEVEGINILSMQYDKIKQVSEDTVLASYLAPRKEVRAPQMPEAVIYPFGLNQSQKLAVERALSSKISIIQGPPGTGKTQTILNAVTTNPEFLPDEGDFIKVTKVDYNLGHRYKENGIQYLYHDDVLKLFCLFLDNTKFRRVFADKYPLILIDEYQDSYKPIIDRFIEFFISKGVGPQFGFFGDAWQTIYQSNKACGEIKHDKIEVIKKGSNFRSAPRIVQLLNDIRPELPQKSAIDGFDGEVLVITCDDYSGARRTERNFKNELPADELRVRLNNIREKIEQTTPADEELKVLMITHKVLASQQGYEQLLDILDDGLRNKEDPFLIFFADTIEPIYYALNTSNIQLLFDTLGIKRYPITKKSEKTKWKSLCNQLTEVRAQKAIDVLEAIIHSKLVPLPPKVDRWYRLYKDAPETMYASEATIQQFLQLDYAQFIAVRDFLYPDAQFSTEHGVKGEEYDNVVFVISKGWNQYQFETYAPMITGHATIPKGKEGSYERNRNLFYVCCSRPKKRLFFFVTVPIETAFRAFLVTLVGEENILTYEQFMKMVH